MHSDTFGYIWKRAEAFRSVRMFSFFLEFFKTRWACGYAMTLFERKSAPEVPEGPLKTLFEQRGSVEVPPGLPNRSVCSASGASENPVRAKKRARSASGASENF